jgi:hypothetical protein
MLLTYLARKYGVAKRAQKQSVFYPVTHHNWKLLCGPPELVRAELTKETRTVHLWRSVLSRKIGDAPPPGSYLEAISREHGLSLAAPSEGESGIHEAPALSGARHRA